MDWPHLLLALLALLLGWAAWSDLSRRLIPNRLVALIALAAPGWWWAQGWGIEPILIQIGLAGAMLALFAALFAAGWMGGGDVKLIAALALWLPLLDLLGMLVWMALGGGLLSLAMLGWRQLRRSAEPIEVPYGLAIAAATAFIMANHILTNPAA